MVKKSWFVMAVAFVLLFVAVPQASAFWPLCSEACGCSSPCSQGCRVGTSVITCGQGYICQDSCAPAFAPVEHTVDSKEAFLTSLAQAITQPAQSSVKSEDSVSNR
jgi:hypothetical protein